MEFSAMEDRMVELDRRLCHVTGNTRICGWSALFYIKRQFDFDFELKSLELWSFSTLDIATETWQRSLDCVHVITLTTHDVLSDRRFISHSFQSFASCVILFNVDIRYEYSKCSQTSLNNCWPQLIEAPNALSASKEKSFVSGGRIWSSRNVSWLNSRWWKKFVGAFSQKPGQNLGFGENRDTRLGRPPLQ